MSHFTVLVVGDDPEGQLAPFSEEIQVDPYKDYEKKPYWFNKLIAEEGGNPASMSDEAIVAWTVARWGSDEPYAYDSNGLYRWSTYNPLSQWDWYQLGGRWAGTFLVKQDVVPNTNSEISWVFGIGQTIDPGSTDQAYKRDIDWEAMRERDIVRRSENYDEAVAEQAKGTPVEFIYGVDPKKISKEEYVAQNHGFSTFAVLMDGEWYERGKMGWWGVVSNEDDEWTTRFEELLTDVPEDTLLSVYDCHI